MMIPVFLFNALQQDLDSNELNAEREQDFMQFGLIFDYSEDKRYRVWVGKSQVDRISTVVKIVAPYCRSLRKAVRDSEIWNAWRKHDRIWEIELNLTKLEQVANLVSNIKMQTLLDGILYYLDEDVIRIHRMQENSLLLQSFKQNYSVQDRQIVYGSCAEEFENGLITYREKMNYDCQWLRVKVFTRERYNRELHDAIKNMDYEILRYHYDCEWKVWELWIPSEIILDQLIEKIQDPQNEWLRNGLNRLHSWFAGIKQRKIQAFEVIGGIKDKEAQASCAIALENGFSIFL